VRPTGTTVIACAALALASCALGIVLGRWTDAPVAPAPAPIGMQTAPPDLEPLLTELRQGNEALLRALAARGANSNPDSTPRESVMPSSDTTERLAAAVEKLTGLLERSGTRLGGLSPALEKWKGPGFPSLDALFDRMEAISGVGDPEWPDKVSTELRQAHLAWTRDDVFERYGAPTSFAGGDRGLSLIFQRVVKPDGIETVSFGTSEGLITTIYFN